MPSHPGIHPAFRKNVGHPGNTSRKTVERTSHPNSGTEATGEKGLNEVSKAFRKGLRKRAIKILGS